jgi:hypothetical protein
MLTSDRERRKTKRKVASCQWYSRPGKVEMMSEAALVEVTVKCGFLQICSFYSTNDAVTKRSITTFMSLNVASRNVTVSKRKSFKT